MTTCTTMPAREVRLIWPHASELAFRGDGLTVTTTPTIEPGREHSYADSVAVEPSRVTGFSVEVRARMNLGDPESVRRASLDLWAVVAERPECRMDVWFGDPWMRWTAARFHVDGGPEEADTNGEFIVLRGMAEAGPDGVAASLRVAPGGPTPGGSGL